MENHWQELWNNRKINLDELAAEDESRLILELKRIVGWDFRGQKVPIGVEEFRKEYDYLKHNLGLTVKADLASVFEVGCGSGANLYFSIRTAFKLAVPITQKICLTLQRKLSARRILLNA